MADEGGREEALLEALGGAIGYLMNARIDCQTGTKASAVRTIDRALDRMRAVFAEAVDDECDSARTRRHDQ